MSELYAMLLLMLLSLTAKWWMKNLLWTVQIIVGSMVAFVLFSPISSKQAWPLFCAAKEGS